MRKQKEKILIKFICITCGKECEREKKESEKYKFCSKLCLYNIHKSVRERFMENKNKDKSS